MVETVGHYLVGIDPGVKTGFATKKKGSKQLIRVKTTTIIQAIEWIKELLLNGCTVDLHIEDARKRTWFTGGREKAQGAGSIKRDCQIWEEWAKTQPGVTLHLIAPKNSMTKVKDGIFKKITGHEGRTSEHARDAAMLIFGRP
ncbi:hypothetical protein HYN46_17115 [Aquirhabdus parva]|uniref:Pre-16S rRNA-processing nuclease YqgF n=2 Tax=Aquirhabdus parva TaxID=2283318 RepID=A0A345PBV7_9GAMM|nr:hypothetical protein HYN46_16870 [Aquirhabdus parva]AXI04769.1 hypothetical protein HYN46_17115 [Aquirhabdus parva]